MPYVKFSLKEMKYIPIEEKKSDNRMWYFIGFLIVFCLVATVVNYVI